MCKLSLVVPCYNEELNVECFYNTVKECFKDKIKEYEIVFVNDGSKDGTYKKLCEIANTSDIKIKVINFSRNFGKEAAILAGLKEANGSYVTLIDADMQQHPDVVLQMVDILDNKPDVDCVAAFQKVRHESKVLGLFKKMFYTIINIISEIKFVQGASDFRTCRKAMIDSILSLKEYPRFSKGIFAWIGYNTEFIPYEVKPRHEGKSKWSFFKLLKYAIDGIMAYSVAPLKVATYTGILTCGSSFIYLLISVLKGMFCSQMITSMQMLLFIVLLMFGMQFIFMGIIGEYLARNYIQSKERPEYIIKNKLENNSEVHHD